MFFHKLVFNYFQYTRFLSLEKQGNLKSGLLDLDGIKLHFYESQNEGRPILFLHGLLDASFGFRKMLPYINKNNKIYLFDLPSFGKSKLPKVKFLYQIDYFANLIYEGIQKLNLKNLTLCGHSMGGLIAQHLALMDRDRRIEKLILLAPGNAPHPERERMRGILFPKTLEEVTRLLSYLYYEKKEEPSDFIKKILISNWNRKEYSYLAENTIRKEKEIFFGAKSKLIKQKTLIISGLNDEITTVSQMKKLHTYISKSKLVFVPNAKHAIHLEHSEKVSNLINDFL
jgi:3-oxoadipate enol-lactonase